MLAELIKLNDKERVLSYLPLAHIVERAGMEGTAVYLGYRVFFSEGIDTFLADLARARPTIFLSVPRLLLKFQQGVFAKIPQRKLERLLRIPILNRAVKKRVLHKLGLDTVINAASGAAPLPTEILLWYRKLGLNLAEGYGMTETLITHLPAPGSVRPGYVGSAIPGVEAKLSADQELLIRSPMNMLGYYKNPGKHEGFFHGGRILPDRRPGADRSRRAAQDCGPIEGAVQDEQGQVRDAHSDRESIDGAPRGGRVLPDGRRDGASVRGGPAGGRGAQIRGAGGGGADVVGPDEYGQYAVGSARAAELCGGGAGAVDGGERVHYADAED